MSYRKPPKPPFYHDYSPGQCRYCGQGIFHPDTGKLKVRANWHPACLREYKILHWPQETRKAVWERDRGQCAGCSTQVSGLRGDWHVDHVRPLIEAEGDIDYWRLSNLATLCIPCHHAKTAAEATARAERRRRRKDG